ncbi:hypothetical protein FisN_32Lh077 [Fistulifera solaris]|uniref:Protein kinase domain-containing protein n=1 Tax=Fistulifera solaris TaxID=1519565 RepID=A0A1Z5JFV9_FISSO|nr:hypothetical protein FisN_32Lh077 [Fistulifera solaris]|eukprot:GAX12900.1 hypothetical protein FisN_32Lh077 [Fistulifera solaris]
MSTPMLASVRRRKAPTLLPHNEHSKENSFVDHKQHQRSFQFTRVRVLIVAASASLWTLFTVYGHHVHQRCWWTYLRRLSWRLDHPSSSSWMSSHSANQTARMILLYDDPIELYPPGRSPVDKLEPIPHLLNPDYNDLEFESYFGRYDDFERHIAKDDADLYHDQRRQFLYDIDNKHLRSYYDGYEDQEFTKDDCRSAGWQFVMKPNCNVFHELALEYSADQDVQPFLVEYLAHGYYRESYRFRNKYWKSGAKVRRNIVYPESEQMVMKHLRYHEDFPINIKNQRAVLREAVLMEALSTRPTFANFYGYCSTSTMLQAGNDFVHQVIPRRLKWQEDDGRATPQQLRRHPDPLNSFTPEQKLSFALSMAEGLAELHGYAKGVISHDDIALDQWVMLDNGNVVLSDVNNAMVLDWNETAGTYCPYDIDYPYGDLRPAEAYWGNGTATETVDLWGYGTLVFSLLTGLYPFYENVDQKANRKLILNGQVPKMDPKYQNRSLIEGRLYDVVQKCIRPLPEDRMDIFSVVNYLRETEQMVATGGEQSPLIE